jgi:hypothetical protein
MMTHESVFDPVMMASFNWALGFRLTSMAAYLWSTQMNLQLPFVSENLREFNEASSKVSKTIAK